MTPASRTGKDLYYLGIAKEVAKRSTCFRRSIGAIIVRDDQIVSTGYAGAPRKTKDSLEHGSCLRDRLGIPHGQRYELCRSVHAEQNAIINAARAGVSLLGGDMFIYGSVPDPGTPVDAFPCFICKKMLINAGLDRVVCSTADGGLKIFRVEEWIKDWQERDIVDDQHQYGKSS
jgi:dCMP deaminase